MLTALMATSSKTATEFLQERVLLITISAPRSKFLESLSASLPELLYACDQRLVTLSGDSIADPVLCLRLHLVHRHNH